MVRLSDRIDTDGFKYADYFSAAGYAGYRPVFVSNPQYLPDISPEKRSVKTPENAGEYLKQLTAYLNEN